MSKHKIVSGEEPTVGLRVFTNDYPWGTITTVGRLVGYDGKTPVECGVYCGAWHTVQIDANAEYCAGQTKTYNCDRLTTREPRRGY
jgi:hypothetical protein